MSVGSRAIDYSKPFELGRACGMKQLGANPLTQVLALVCQAFVHISRGGRPSLPETTWDGHAVGDPEFQAADWHQLAASDDGNLYDKAFFGDREPLLLRQGRDAWYAEMCKHMPGKERFRQLLLAV
ncbi:unnamed protein product [Durusdinium trenchii]|uniref:Uncharacterized protein n=1 Tax=Durusdinium trenchii TaxID=1381693 RepID=A0ABP0PN05_9DINO